MKLQEYQAKQMVRDQGVSVLAGGVADTPEAATGMAEFFYRCGQQDDYWKTISDAGLQRVAERYTWDRYAEKMMTLSRIYGFWKYVSNLERAETQRYLQMFYSLQFRPLAQQLER